MEKKWNAPELQELNVKETAVGLFGPYKDGGLFGTGILEDGWCNPGQGDS